MFESMKYIYKELSQNYSQMIIIKYKFELKGKLEKNV